MSRNTCMYEFALVCNGYTSYRLTCNEMRYDNFQMTRNNREIIHRVEAKSRRLSTYPAFYDVKMIGRHPSTAKAVRYTCCVMFAV